MIRYGLIFAIIIVVLASWGHYCGAQEIVTLVQEGTFSSTIESEIPRVKSVEVNRADNTEKTYAYRLEVVLDNLVKGKEYTLWLHLFGQDMKIQNFVAVDESMGFSFYQHRATAAFFLTEQE